MMRQTIVKRLVAALLWTASVGVAAQVVPPAGYRDAPRRAGDSPAPGVATPAEPGAPALVRIPDTMFADRFRIDPHYSRAARAHVTVVGAFAVAEPAGVRLTSAWAAGFLPVLLTFSDGRCFSLSADYDGGTLSNGRLRRAGCDHRTIPTPPPTPLAGRALRPVGSSWGYGAWVDDAADTTIVTAPNQGPAEALFTARMNTVAIAAMNGPDWPGGNVTLVGRVDGRMTVVTLEVGF